MDAKTLKMMSRKDIQKLAQRENIKANLKSESIINMLLKKYPEGVPRLVSPQSKRIANPTASSESASKGVDMQEAEANVGSTNADVGERPTHAARSAANSDGPTAAPAQEIVTDSTGSVSRAVSITNLNTVPALPSKIKEAQQLPQEGHATAKKGADNHSGQFSAGSPVRIEPRNPGFTEDKVEQASAKSSAKRSVEEKGAATSRIHSPTGHHLWARAEVLLASISANPRPFEPVFRAGLSSPQRTRNADSSTAVSARARAEGVPSFPGGRRILEPTFPGGQSVPQPAFPGGRNILEPPVRGSSVVDKTAEEDDEVDTNPAEAAPLGRQLVLSGGDELPAQQSSPGDAPASRPREVRVREMLRNMRTLVDEVPTLQRELAEGQQLLLVTEQFKAQNEAKLAAMRKERKILERYLLTQLKRDERLHNGTHSWQPPAPGGEDVDHAFVGEVSEARSSDNFVESDAPTASPEVREGVSMGEGGDEIESEMVASISRLKVDG